MIITNKPGLQVLVDVEVEFGKPGALLTAIPAFEDWFKSQNIEKMGLFWLMELYWQRFSYLDKKLANFV